jgi:hypothetical protein
LGSHSQTTTPSKTSSLPQGEVTWTEKQQATAAVQQYFDPEIELKDTLEFDPMAPKTFVPHLVLDDDTPRKVIVER